MALKRQRSPQEKKALSYAHDRRNAYGESNKGSRKAIPRNKAKEHRDGRHKVAANLQLFERVGDVEAEVIESSAAHDVFRKGGWRKSSDIALRDFVIWKGQIRLRREDPLFAGDGWPSPPHSF